MHKTCKHCGQDFEGVHNKLLCPNCSNLKLELICPHCGTAFVLPDKTKRDFFTGSRSGPFYCSRRCAFSSDYAKVKRIETTRRKYGVDNVSQSDMIKDRKNITTMQHYGVENPFQSEVIKGVCRRRHQERYGVDNPSQAEEIKDKKAVTCFKHYGCKSHMQSQIFMDNWNSFKNGFVQNKIIYKGRAFSTRSFWETIFAIYLAFKNIPFQYEQVKINYQFQSANHVYFPDFYIPEFNYLVEIKGWVTEKDKAKWDAVEQLDYHFEVINNIQPFVVILNKTYHFNVMTLYKESRMADDRVIVDLKKLRKQYV